LVSATDKYSGTCHSVHITQPYTGTAYNHDLAPQQSYVLPGMASREKLAWQRTY